MFKFCAEAAAFLITVGVGSMSYAQSAPPALPDLAAPTLAAPEGTGLLTDLVPPTEAARPAEASATSAPTSPHDTFVVQADPEAAPAPEPGVSSGTTRAGMAARDALKFLEDGGPSIWAIAALAVATLALILWKVWRLALLGAWSKGKAWRAVEDFERGAFDAALTAVNHRQGVRSKVVAAGLVSLRNLPEEKAREEVERVAKGELAKARAGLGALELISTIAPLLGLLGTVLGMIAAFQALQAAGSKADPALLAGGIWEALLTTAAGMAVAIPASAALTWFEAVIDRIRRDVEDAATRLFVATTPQQVLALAAE